MQREFNDPEPRVLRKRRKLGASPIDGVTALLNLASRASRIIVFSGSGLSADSGMSTFSTAGGLYEKAQKRFGVTDGKRLFAWQLYEKRKLEVLSFYADIYAEAKRALPGPGHYALRRLERTGKLLRHYTMNIDGLAEVAGLSIWNPERNPEGSTVEMHGNIRFLVCPSCKARALMTEHFLRQLRSKKPIKCRSCEHGQLRCCILLYDDAEDAAVTPSDILDTLENDLQTADLILWVGVSFEQSASTEYFRQVRRMLQESGRLKLCKQVIVNLSDEALWNVLSATNNAGKHLCSPAVLQKVVRIECGIMHLAEGWRLCFQ
eukprot:jgi/Botrbrau1/4907/Bobra.118_1s0020.2